MPRPRKLATSASALVLQQLKKSRRPLSAYQLLEKLHPHGVKAPPIVYRALDELVIKGSVHKIRELSSFVACNCSKDHHHALSVLTVCGMCQKVEELHDKAVIQQLEGLRRLGIGLRNQAVIELPVVCKHCELAQGDAATA